MNVLIVTNQFPSNTFPYKGSFVYEQVTELKRKLNDIFVISPNYGRDEKKEVFNDIEIYRFKVFTKKTEDPLLRNLFKGLRGKLALLLFVLLQTMKIIKIIRKHKISVVHAHWILPSGFSAFIATKLTRKKLVITAHGSDITYCGSKTVLRIPLRYILKRTDFTIGVCDFITEKALSLGAREEKTRTIYLGISRSIKKYYNPVSIQELRSRRISLIMIGSLYPIKGIEILMETIDRLSKLEEDFRLVIVGDGELRPFIEDFIKEKNLTDFVIVKGFLPHSTTLEEIAEADITVQTSFSEGLSISLQESIFLGKPIVATNVGGTSEIVQDNVNGFLVQSKDIESLVKKLSKLISNPSLIKKMGEKSHLIAKEKLSLEKNIQEIIEEYKFLVA